MSEVHRNSSPGPESRADAVRRVERLGEAFHALVVDSEDDGLPEGDFEQPKGDHCERRRQHRLFQQ